MTHTGQCRCGQVRFRLNAPPLITMACHCRGCQRMTASAFSLSVLVAEDAFEVTEGQPVIGGIHGATRHHHCGHCKSWLFTRPEGVEGLVNVRTAMLDDPAGFEPFVETMTRERMPWATTPAQASYEGFPASEDFGPLLRRYAERNPAELPPDR